MENGELDIWDPAKILQGNRWVYERDRLAGARPDKLCSPVPRHPWCTSRRIMLVRSVDSTSIQSRTTSSHLEQAKARCGHLRAQDLSQRLTLSQVFIWDLNNPVKPFAPPASRSLDDVSAVGWNRVVQSVLAASSVNGYTVVWDIREANGQKGREVSALSYSGAGAGYPGQGGPGYGGQWGGPGGRPGGVSSVVWHPDNVRRSLMHNRTLADVAPIVIPADKACICV